VRKRRLDYPALSRSASVSCLLLQVRIHFPREFGIGPEQVYISNQGVTPLAQNTANLLGLMIVIDVESATAVVGSTHIALLRGSEPSDLFSGNPVLPGGEVIP